MIIWIPFMTFYAPPENLLDILLHPEFQLVFYIIHQLNLFYNETILTYNIVDDNDHTGQRNN